MKEMIANLVSRPLRPAETILTMSTRRHVDEANVSVVKQGVPDGRRHNAGPRRYCRRTLSHIPEELTGQNVTSDAWRIIMDTPEGLAPMKLRLDRPFEMVAVYRGTGDAENPLELIGDYENPSLTVVQIPGWL